MQFNKCSRCGCFYTSNSSVCPNCAPKDLYDINKLKNFLEESSTDSSIEEISLETGISTKNLHRFFSSDELTNSNFNEFGNEPKTQL